MFGTDSLAALCHKTPNQPTNELNIMFNFLLNFPNLFMMRRILTIFFSLYSAFQASSAKFARLNVLLFFFNADSQVFSVLFISMISFLPCYVKPIY